MVLAPYGILPLALPHCWSRAGEVRVHVAMRLPLPQPEDPLSLSLACLTFFLSSSRRSKHRIVHGHRESVQALHAPLVRFRRSEVVVRQRNLHQELSQHIPATSKVGRIAKQIKPPRCSAGPGICCHDLQRDPQPINFLVAVNFVRSLYQGLGFRF